MKKKLVIKSEIEIEELENFIRTKVKRIKKILAVVFHVLEFSFKGMLYLIIGDRIFEISQRTQPKKNDVKQKKQSVHSTKNAENTAKTLYFAPVQTADNEQENSEGREGVWVESSTLRKCENPDCEKTFERVVRGNQEKKFCSSVCKDIVNNRKKMNNYYQYEK